VAVPGKLTSATLLLKLFSPEVDTIVVPFDQISGAVVEGRVEAGLLIHEGQLTYTAAGLHKVVDLGAWWKEQTGLPVPLGGNAARRGLDPDLVRRIASVLERSIRHALEHRHAALEYAMQFARGLPAELGDQFVGLYVNRWTLDCGEVGHQSIQLFLDRAFEQRLIPTRVAVDVVTVG
jgi:1,4-dihydroxy-6-naphthoate synthase